MPEFFNYSPHNGVRETWDYDEERGQAIFRHEADHELFFKRNAELRASGVADRGLMDGGREFRFYASLSPVVQIELRQKGIDIYSSDPAMVKRLLQEINRNYPHCKVTDKTHE